MGRGFSRGCFRAPSRRRERVLYDEDFRLKGAALEGNTARYSTMLSTKEELGTEHEYIPRDSVEERVLTVEQAEEARSILCSERWARRPVARDEDWSQYQYGEFPRWKLDIKSDTVEYFTAHKPGPDGQGGYLGPKWERLTRILLDEE